jgi:tetratricopeptide (TPR) repeat protein
VTVARVVRASDPRTLAAALCCLFPVGIAAAEVPPAQPCGAVTQSPALAEAAAALERDAAALEARVKLVDALLAQSCYADAVHLLEEGEQIHPRNSALQSRLRDARSMLSEQRYFEGLGRAEESAKIQRNVLRCNKLGDISACDEALHARPDDWEIILAKADALLQSNRPAEALPAYRRAAELDPGNAEIKTKIAAAESQRLALLSQCQHGNGDGALQACQAALLRGVSDELIVYQREAILLQSMDQPSRALDAYIAANLLKPDDRAVALAIVALTDSSDRRDAMALAARGSALLTLGRAVESVSVLRQAQALAPGLPELKSHLAAAEQLAKTEVRRASRTTQDAVSSKGVSEVATAAGTGPGATPGVTPGASAGGGTAPTQGSTRVAAEERRVYSNNDAASRSN